MASLILAGTVAAVGQIEAPLPIFSLASGVFTNETVTFTLNAPEGSVRYTVDGSVPTETSPLYASPITVGTNVVVKARTFAPGMLPGPVASRIYQFLDPSAAEFSSNLPLLALTTSGRNIPENVPPGQPRVPGALVVIDAEDGRSTLHKPPQFAGLAEFEIFGQTSAGFPESPYTIEIQDEYRKDREVPLLGLPAEADWKLRGVYNDKGRMNEVLALELFEQMGHYTVRRRYVEVFVTRLGRISYPRDYVGLRVLLEKIEVGPGRVSLSRLNPTDAAEPDISGGYIWKKEKDSMGDLNFATAGGSGFAPQLFKIHEPKPRDITTNQLNWLRNHLSEFERSLYSPNWLTATGTNHYSHYIEVDSLVDQHWIVEFTKNIDGYRLGNFMQKDRGGKIRMDLLWDWELSFGNADYLSGGKTNGWYWNLVSDREHVWLRRLLYGWPGVSGISPVIGTGDPEFIQKIVDRWGTLRTNILAPGRLLARVDQLADELAEAVGRDEQKYPRLGTFVWPNPGGPPFWDVDYVNPATYPAIIQQLKKWIEGRFHWIDGQMVRAPLFNHGGGAVEPGSNLTMASPSGTIHYTLDGSDPRLPGGEISSTAQVYTGPLTIDRNVRVFARARIGGGVYDWSPPAVATFVPHPSPLRVTEIMYHAAGTDSIADDDLEYVELRNIGSAPLDLTGYQLNGTITFTFPASTLLPGARTLVVRNRTAFESRYGHGLPVAGEYSGSLTDDGGRILLLETPFLPPVLDFRYEDHWFPSTDGPGFSLVIRDDTGPPGTWGQADRWRPSGVVDGSPGSADPAPPFIPRVIISEVLASVEPPDLPQVEVQNLASEAVNLGGWFLTDRFDRPKKLPLPPDTILPPGGFRVFTENDFGPQPTNEPIFPALGGELHLFSGDSSGKLTGYAHRFVYGPEETGVSFGRHLTNQGEEHFVAQQMPTLGTTNAGPKDPSIRINEILYRPPPFIAGETDDEFIELANSGPATVDLFDPAAPEYRWKIHGAVDYVFPANVSLPPGGFLLVVGFDPLSEPARLAAFRTRHDVPASSAVFGPYQGTLNDQGATLTLAKPLVHAASSPVHHALVEQVRYSSRAPWPVAADGTGFSLSRAIEFQYANDPAHWSSTAPTPGRTNSIGVPPTILRQPQSQTGITFDPVTFAVEVDGAGPYRYQWRRNGVLLPSATNALLQIDRVRFSDAGEYEVVILGENSAATSLPATLSVLSKIAILEQPRSQTAHAGSNTTFVVLTESGYPVRYQWRHNGLDVPGATNQTLTLQNVTNVDEGTYTVVCTDAVGAVLSQPAELTVLMPAVVAFPAPPVHLTAAPGEIVTLGVELHGTLPIYCRWRIFRPDGSGIILTNQLLGQRFSFITVPVTTNSAGAYTVILSNGVASAMNKAITNATLSLVQDADHDLLPDEFEARHGLDPADPADGAGGADADGDGLSNRAEYVAGTDPQDGSSFLRVDAVSEAGMIHLQFGALSNRTYTLQYSDTLAPGIWRRLGDVLARQTNRVESVTDRAPNPEFRFYRVVTPRQP